MGMVRRIAYAYVDAICCHLHNRAVIDKHESWTREMNTKWPSGKKRQAELSLDEEIAAYKADLNDTIDYATFENDSLPSCNAIRTKLNKLFDSGVVNKAEFCRATETDEVPIYDDCDEIRRKINAHMKIPSVTQAQFCRDIHAQFKAPTCKRIQSKQLSDFRKAKGSNAGAKSSVFYGAYVYFEKMRIAQKKPVTKHRDEMTFMHPGDIPRERDDRTTWIIGAA
ncbi:hypothetical protein FANTH_13304 [Fusarium anthophilum]|uniref:DUF7726 domain-containing protein n=1 Tax=Fusarium anthophilum TaxID=48485 RepID=A0A8H5DQ68_9HYPO|nr:hypothetical protein FANTH_13304 [Fusarium anthophilum]